MKQVWADLEIFTGQSPLWSSPSIDACLNDFLIKPSLHCWKALPLLVARGLWLAHNDCLFGNQSRPTYKVSQQVTAISRAYKVSTFIKTPWQISPLNINQTNPWGFFDRACQGAEKICGLGFLIFFTLSHFITGKANIGKGTNNLAEFSALLALLKLAAHKGIAKCHNIQRLQFMHWLDETQISATTHI